jgi:glycosyltransferase involved in cell wall biosynthesis
LATSLSKNNDVAVLFGGQGLLAEKLKIAGIRTIVLPSLNREMNIFKDTAKAFRILKILKYEKPDALILNSSKIGGVGSFAGRLAGVKKIIFVAHGFAWNENRNASWKMFVKFLYSLIFLFSTKIIAVSDSIREQGSRLPFGKKKMKVIKLGINAAPILSKESARQALGIPSDAFAIGTLAELHPIKGLAYAIEAIPLLEIPNMEYFILGEGELRKELEDEIVENKLQNKVFLKGFVKDAAKYLKAFDIFLLPSLSEALSYTLIEAGLAEIPVIATSVGGVPEVIENEKTGLLIRPKNPKEIANAIRVLYENKENAELYAKNLHEKVAKEFSLEKMISETEKFIAG